MRSIVTYFSCLVVASHAGFLLRALAFCLSCLVYLQYYGEVLSKKPVELHRFYKDESTFCHASGTKEEVSDGMRQDR